MHALRIFTTGSAAEFRAGFNRFRANATRLMMATLCLASVQQSCAELAFQVLYTFPTSNPHPWAVNKLVEGDDGDFYGTSFLGGSNNCGTVFRITTAGALTTLFSFNGTNGQGPLGGLTRGNDGNFYGVTAFGGDEFIDPIIHSGKGTIFRITTNGDLTTLVF